MSLIPINKQRNKDSSKAYLITLRDAINRLFDESLFSSWLSPGNDSAFEHSGRLDRIGALFSDLEAMKPLNVDFSESDSAYLIEADVPGYRAEDIDVELKSRVLYITGRKSKSEEKKEKTYHVQERSESEFKRSFALPNNADLEGIDCSVKDGKLNISIGKTEKEISKKLEIQSGE